MDWLARDCLGEAGNRAPSCLQNDTVSLDEDDGLSRAHDSDLLIPRRSRNCHSVCTIAHLRRSGHARG
jgi:hypothetical protein